MADHDILKKRLSDALTAMIGVVDRLSSIVGPSNRSGSGDFETWAAKDFIAHSAEWARRQRQRLREPEEVTALDGWAEIETYNRRLFEEHANTTWDDAVAMLRSSVAALLDEVASRSGEALAAPDPESDGRYGVWRGIAFYGIVHPLSHIAQGLARAGHATEALELQEAMTPQLLDLDPSDRWQGTIEYNHARALALAANPAAVEYAKRAVEHTPVAAKWIAGDADFAAIRDAVLTTDRFDQNPR